MTAGGDREVHAAREQERRENSVRWVALVPAGPEARDQRELVALVARRLIIHRWETRSDDMGRVPIGARDDEI